MNRPNIHAVTQQLPVGQGGFMFTRLRGTDSSGSEKQFHFAFDCGSVNREHLERGFQYVECDRLDMLFVSHLDADHVNGIDQLAARLRIDMVVLPCLDELTLISIACSSASAGAVPESVANFLRNPRRWFGERGIKRVAFLRRDEPGGQPAPVRPSDPRMGKFVQSLASTETEDGMKVEVWTSSVSELTSKNHEALTVVLGPETQILTTLPNGSSNTDWLLVPYVHPFPAEVKSLFLHAVARVLKVKENTTSATARFTNALLRALKDEDKRASLKACYRILAANHNRVSMSLYSGPIGGNASVSWTLFQSFSANWPDIGPGWLTTGDADLRSTSTKSPWLQRFGSLADEVGVFVLPHHGSAYNIGTDVLQKFFRAQFVVCAATGRSHHPHPRLLARLDEMGTGHVQVSELQRSIASMLVRVIG